MLKSSSASAGGRGVGSWFQEHKTSINAWTGFALTVFIVFIFISDRDFSFLLTLSSLVSTFCFFMVAQKIEKQGNVKGVSIKMFECYLILLTCRLFSIIPFEGYLPYDRTGDWLYQLTEALSLCLCGTIVYMGRKRYNATYDANQDAFKHISWTFALYLEAVASLPQLYYFQKDVSPIGKHPLFFQKRVEPFTSHFLAGQCLAKILSFIFWVATYSELNDPSRKLKSFAGIWVIIGQVIQLILMGDFMYLYLKW
ncbi:putative ER lumen protein retaining receptor [Gregarina niphandrodes]|uniref:ER lumen protein retaining receptor n=1 Tax=Gregarina niphandrodes TaxID=110365 RepID=A0A023BBF1_GRENI|nr:putative ER lumen protein retaining receptor [Gregarina niphandrodes]EZG79652.1 putative ER lumen protein retaining receptor [Gregarina niphandrodes]|eukprot:XP_011134397.1 putative ER lumen protein retaining receptor [Gregarina niphandrodes]